MMPHLVGASCQIGCGRGTNFRRRYPLAGEDLIEPCLQRSHSLRISALIAKAASALTEVSGIPTVVYGGARRA